MSDISRRTIIGAATVGAAVLATTQNAAAKVETPETIAIIGTGNVGSTLGKRWAALGHKIIYGSRSPDSDKTKKLLAETGNGATAVVQSAAARTAGVVLLATPSQSALEIVASLGDLSGKVVMDAMNAMTFNAGKLIEPPDTEALAARIQDMAPRAYVVKAFNTTNTTAMRDPKLTGGPITIPIAGASLDAKARVSALITQLGLEVFDMGDASALKFLEHLGRIYVGYSVANRPQRMEFSFRTWSP